MAYTVMAYVVMAYINMRSLTGGDKPRRARDGGTALRLPCRLMGVVERGLGAADVASLRLLGQLHSRHRRRHVYCAGMAVPVPRMTASPRRSFWVPARPYLRNRHAVGDADIQLCPINIYEISWVAGQEVGHNRQGVAHPGPR